MKIWYKKICALLISAILVLSMCAFVPIVTEKQDTVTDAHIYTVLPDSEEWATMTLAERRKSCYVDEDEATKMSTAGLVETVLNYPYFVDIYAFNSIEEGIARVSRRFPPLAELLDRSDANVALQEYLNKRHSINKKNLSVNSAEDHVSKTYGAQRLILIIEKKQAVAEPNTLVFVKTPKGTSVPVFKGRTWAEAGISQEEANVQSAVLLTRYKSAKLIYSANPQYNCHSFAWYSASPSNPYWMNNPSPYMNDESYVSAGYTASATNKITYYEMHPQLGYTCIHSGIIQSNGQVISKWGVCAAFTHDIYDCPYAEPENPVPPPYVSVRYWKRNY